MERFSQDNRKHGSASSGDDKNFILKKAGKMDMFKIEIFCSEFLDIMADIISNPGTKYNAMKEMIDGIHKPVEMKIDSEVYKHLILLGEKKDVELVCKYVAVHRILSAVDNSRFIGMMEKVRGALREVPVSTRHVLTSDRYRDIYAIVPAAYLASVANLEHVSAEIGKMDKSKARTMSEIINGLKELTTIDDTVIGEIYTAIVDVTKRILFAYRDHNSIDLGNVRKLLGDMFDGNLMDYFNKLLVRMNKDISDSFASFEELVREMKESDDEGFMSDEPDPSEYDKIEDDTSVATEEPEDDFNNDSILGPDETMTTPVSTMNTGLDAGGVEPAADNTTAVDAGTNPGGVVTGLESVMMEGPLFRKKLKRISRNAVGYVKVRGANARDADELTMIVCYGYSVAERCEWYMDIIQREDDRYIVPQSYAELESIKKDMYHALDELTRKPFFRQKGSIYTSAAGIGFESPE